MARGGDITGQARGERRVVLVRSASVLARRGIRALGSASSALASSEVGNLVHHSIGADISALHRNAMKRGYGGNTGIATELLNSAESPVGFICRAYLERVARAALSSEGAVQAADLLRRAPRVPDLLRLGGVVTARTRATGQGRAATVQLGACPTRSTTPCASGGGGHGDVIA
jgi:hypothetical protein